MKTILLISFVWISYFIEGNDDEDDGWRKKELTGDGSDISDYGILEGDANDRKDSGRILYEGYDRSNLNDEES